MSCQFMHLYLLMFFNISIWSYKLRRHIRRRKIGSFFLDFTKARSKLVKSNNFTEDMKYVSKHYDSVEGMLSD